MAAARPWSVRTSADAPPSPPAPPTVRRRQGRGPPPRSRPRAPRSSTCRTASTPTRSPRSRRSRPRRGSPTRSAPRLRGRAPGRAASRPPSAAGSPAARGRRAADRHPRRVRRAARASATAAGTTRWPRPGVGAAIALAAVARRAGPARSCSSGTPGRGAGERQGDHAPGRAVRGPRRGAAVPPLRPQPRRDRSRSRRRTSTVVFTGLQSHAACDAVGGPQRARRDDRAVLVGRACGASSCRPTAASTGSSRRAARRRTSSRTGRGPGSCSGAPTRRTTR